MATFYLPKIAPEDHETFRGIVEHYPADTYDKWRELQSKEIAQHQAGGHKVELVEISPDEFTRYCDRVGAKRDIHTLRGIAFEKGTREQ